MATPLVLRAGFWDLSGCGKFSLAVSVSWDISGLGSGLSEISAFAVLASLEPPPACAQHEPLAHGFYLHLLLICKVPTRFGPRIM